jgi:hypothetical protein
MIAGYSESIPAKDQSGRRYSFFAFGLGGGGTILVNFPPACS